MGSGPAEFAGHSQFCGMASGAQFGEGFDGLGDAFWFHMGSSGKELPAV